MLHKQDSYRKDPKIEGELHSKYYTTPSDNHIGNMTTMIAHSLTYRELQLGRVRECKICR